MDEMLALRMFGKQLRGEYETANIPAPEWLDDKVRQLNREIELRRRDTLEMRLKEIRAQRTQLLTPSERRVQLEVEEAELNKQLGNAVPATTT